MTLAQIFHRYERGLEDYEEAINNVEQNSDKQTSQFSDGSNTMQQILNVLSTLFSQSLKTARKVNQLSQTGTINKNGPKNNQSSDNNEAETVKNAEGI